MFTHANINQCYYHKYHRSQLKLTSNVFIPESCPCEIKMESIVSAFKSNHELSVLSGSGDSVSGASGALGFDI